MNIAVDQPAPSPKGAWKKKGKKTPKPTKPAKRSKANTRPPQGEDQHLDPSNLSQQAAARRLEKIYKLQEDIDTAQASFERASALRREAKGRLDEARKALDIEVEGQRKGPGPLFNADGSGAAGTPVGQG